MRCTKETVEIEGFEVVFFGDGSELVVDGVYRDGELCDDDCDSIISRASEILFQ